jgi:signal transduction histidine kinase
MLVGAAERRRTVRDWAVGIAAVVVMSVDVSVGPAVEVSGIGAAVAPALAPIAGLALVWRRRWPGRVAAIAVAVSGVDALVSGPVVPVAGWLAIVVVTRHVTTVSAALRGAVAATLGVIAGSAAAAFLHDRTAALPLAVSLTVVVLLAAALARLQAARLEAQRRQREAERQQAITDERLRIARDLHDLVGHGLSSIAVQSSAARLALTAGDPHAAGRALAAIEKASRGALAETRQLLGVLRRGDGDTTPTPGLDRIDELVDAARAAGHSVTVDRVGPVDAVPAATGLTAYRVVQEAVTNAIRYAERAPIAVLLRAGETSLTVEVIDDGDGPPPVAGRPRYGLAGLRERVAAAGGTLETGRRTDATGWRVAARLPIRDGREA